MLDVLTRGCFFVTDTPETFMNSEQNFLIDQMMVNVFTWVWHVYTIHKWNSTVTKFYTCIK